MTRNQNIKRNLIYNTTRTVVNLILGFVSRTILIHYLGVEYLGLNGLFSNIFTILNLAELGIGSAIVFSMYKPVAENNIEKTKALQNLYKKFYLIIALVVVGLGLILLPFLDILIKNDVSSDINIYVLYVMYLVNTIFSYFSAHKRSLLFAYQRNDIENKVVTVVSIVSTLVQILVLVLFRDYYVYYSISILASLVNCYLISRIANKMYPEINGKSEPLDEETKKEISKNIAALSVHKIGSAVVTSTDNIIISAFLGTIVLGCYSNYFLLITYIIMVFSIISNALTGSVGNLIASTDIEYSYTKYKQINFVFVYLTAFCTICLMCLFQPFMAIWTGGGVYILDYSTVILLCISFYISRIITAPSIYKECAGIFKQDKWRPLFEAIINLTISIILVNEIGVNGVIIGTIISSLVCPFWIGPHMVFKHYFKKSTLNYFKRLFVDIVKFVLALVPCIIVCNLIPDGGIWLFIAKMASCIVLSNIILVVLYLPTREFRECFGILKTMIKRLKLKNN